METRTLFNATGSTEDAEAAVNDLFASTAVNAVASIPVVGGVAQAVLGWALSFGAEDPQAGQFDKVNSRIDALSDDVAHLQGTVNTLSQKVDAVIRDAVITSIPTAEVKAAQAAFEDYLNASTKNSRIAAKDEFMSKAKHLDVAIIKFEEAFQGAGGRTNLMQAFSEALKKQAPTFPFLTNANYTMPLRQVYEYYKSYEAMALNLRVEYLHARGLPDSARSIVHKVKNNLTIDASTMPKPIPSYGVFDTRNGEMWSTFGSISLNYHLAAGDFLKAVNGDTTAGSRIAADYLVNALPVNKAAATVLSNELAENKNLGIKTPFKWSLPSEELLTTLKSDLQTNDAVVYAYLPSKGFNPSITNHQVFTSNMYWKYKFMNTSKNPPFLDYGYLPATQPQPANTVGKFGASIIAGFDNSNGKRRFYFNMGKDSPLNTGIQPFYRTNLGVDYATAKTVGAVFG